VVQEGNLRKGGFAEVLPAWDVAVDPPQKVAIKLFGAIHGETELGKRSAHREFDSLMRLEHEHVVRLLGAGVESTTGQTFLVLEWVENDMLSYLREGDPEPDDFIQAIGLPIALAMKVAHERGIAHRDLKPENVLLTTDGKVKVADFGISRIMEAWRSADVAGQSVLAAYGSVPYAPPQRDSDPLQRDVWGLGATLLSGLVRRPLKDTKIDGHRYDDLYQALKELDVVDDLREILERCLSDNPARRPADCQVVHAELADYWQKRSKNTTKRPKVYLGLANSAVQKMPQEDRRSAARAIVGDLEGGRIVCAARAEGAERHYLLLGQARAYRVVRDAQRDWVDTGTVRRQVERPRCVVIDVFQPNRREVDRIHDEGAPLDDFEFRHEEQIANRVSAAEALDLLLDRAERQEIQVRERRERGDATGTVQQWRKQLDARVRFEHDREQPVRYSAARVDGRSVYFTIRPEALSRVEIGEIRRVQSENVRRSRVTGEVLDIDETEVRLVCAEAPSSVPTRGVLVVDTKPSVSKIRREEGALGALTDGGGLAVRPDLQMRVLTPASNRDPNPVSIADWVHEHLDESKKRAVQAALGAPDIFMVQGPPGTGKTTFIAELVGQELRKNPEAKILVASQTNVALDNALMRIKDLPESRFVLRLADPKFGKISAGAENLRFDRQMRTWRDEVRNRSDGWLNGWVEGRGVSTEKVNESRYLLSLAALLAERALLDKSIDDLQVRREACQEGSDEWSEIESQEDELLERYEASESDERDLRQRFKGIARRFDRELPDATAKQLRQHADLLLGGRAIADELRNFVGLHAEWTQRLARPDGFATALAAEANVIGATCVGLAAMRDISGAAFDLCIIDESSKATATETLVPMVRGRRWVLVGDERQLPPMVDEALRDERLMAELDLDQDEIRMTLFSRLSQGLPDACKVLLDRQHRMVEAIGNLVSKCFYDGLLTSDGPQVVTTDSRVFPKPVTWHDTSELAGRHESQRASGTSFVNTTEAGVVIRLVRQLLKSLGEGSESRSILIIAPYRDQTLELTRRIASLGHRGPHTIEVATVDAVQGREADFVFFSVTRSNTGNRFGFLSLDARANVALSRARLGLAIVGDWKFCMSGRGPFRDVANHIRSHRDECARIEVSS